MKLQCLIIDDEPLARKGLKEYIREIDFLELAGEFENPLQARDKVESGSIDLLLLDIQMPVLGGMDFLRSLKSPPPVIFTTAFPQHALDGFDLNALDYLVKPIAFDRFYKAVCRAREHFELRQKNQSTAEGGEGYFFIKVDNKLVKINYQDIVFIEALQNYVVVHTTAGKYITYLTLRSVEEYLPSPLFIKTHKSYIVSAARVDSIEGNEIILGKNHVPISRNLKEDVMEKLLQGRFLKR